MLVALLATTTMFADADSGWNEPKKFSPVTNGEELYDVHTVVAADGSAYASSSITKELSFGGYTLTPAIAGSTCIVKYDSEGNEKWAILFSGANSLNGLAVDADGALYATGMIAESSVEFIGTDGNSKTLSNPTKYDPDWGMDVVSGYAAYIVKITPAGVITDAVTVDPSGPEVTYWGEARISPNKIVVDNGKVYVSCFYQGEVPALSWTGRYVMGMDFDTFETQIWGDIPSAGLFTVNSSDLSGLTGLANLQATINADVIYDENPLQCAPEAFTFVVSSGLVGVGFFGWGNVTLSVPGQEAKNFSFEMQGGGVNEHALVMSLLTDINNMTKIFHATPYDNQGFAQYNLMADVTGTNVILGGTFYGSFPLDNTVTKDKNTSFVASVPMMSTGSGWAKINEAEEESFATGMIVTPEEIHAATKAYNFTYDTSVGTLKGSEGKGYNDASISNDTYVSLVYTEGTDVCVMEIHMNPSAVTEVKAASAVGTKFYSIGGMEIAAPQKGLSIVKTADGVVKIAK